MTNLSEVQQLGRAKNAISAYLDRHLVVPKIFLDATWAEQEVDLLAIDRAGVGDVYAVKLRLDQMIPNQTEEAAALSINESIRSIEWLLSVPSQYKYVAIVTGQIANTQKRGLSDGWDALTTFAEDGVGRVGLFSVVDISGDEVRVDEIVKAERFRSSRKILELTDTFVASHTANKEYRDPIYDQEVSA